MERGLKSGRGEATNSIHSDLVLPRYAVGKCPREILCRPLLAALDGFHQRCVAEHVLRKPLGLVTGLYEELLLAISDRSIDAEVLYVQCVKLARGSKDGS